MQGNVNVSTYENDIVVLLGNEKKVSEKYTDLSLASVKYVHSDLNDLQHSYIRLGFHLRELLLCNYHYQFGYWDFYNFCAANFGLDRSTVSRLMEVSKEFSRKNDNMHHTPTMFIDDRYKDYSYSQLCEMLPLSSDQRKQIKPNMTVKQIRELKKQFKKKPVVDSTPEVDNKKSIVPIFSNAFWDLFMQSINNFFSNNCHEFRRLDYSYGICKKITFRSDDKEYEILFRVRK
ncbi:MAG: hypothetical protein IIX48_01095 [Lachnospiraceae bacterium]|nr:hypothetical protein [Lachnospiraceae bacterium]